MQKPARAVRSRDVTAGQCGCDGRCDAGEGGQKPGLEGPHLSWYRTAKERKQPARSDPAKDTHKESGAGEMEMLSPSLAQSGTSGRARLKGVSGRSR